MAVFYAIHAIVPFAFLDDAANGAGIAVIHTTFNVCATLVLLPFSSLLEKLACLTIREDEKEEEKNEDFLLLDERFLAQPAFAVEQCRVVAGRMARLTKESVDEAGRLLVTEYDTERAERIAALETQIDQYEDKLGTYLVKLSHSNLSKNDSHTVSMLLHSISDFERISDHAASLMHAAKEMNDKGLHFSEMAAKELTVFSKATRDIVNRAVKCFETGDLQMAATVEPLESAIDSINAKIKNRHIARLQRGECTIELGFILQDISTDFERISDHCSNIAVYQIEVPQDVLDAHEYLQSMRHISGNAFDIARKNYKMLYALPKE